MCGKHNLLDLSWQYDLKSILFRNKTFFFQDRKLKLSACLCSWISWNLTQFQLIQIIQTMVIFIFFYWLSDWVEILWRFMKFFFKQILKVSAICLDKQKSFNPKKRFKPLPISKQKSFVYWPNFQWRFWSGKHRSAYAIKVQKYAVHSLLPKRGTSLPQEDRENKNSISKQ